MKQTFVLILIFSVIFPMELLGQVLVDGRRDRARSNSMENFRKIMNIGNLGWDAGITFGTSHSLSDIGGTGTHAQFLFIDAQPRATGIQLGGFSRYRFNDLIALRAGVNYASLGAADSLSPHYSGRYPRGYHFRNTLFEVSLEAELYIPKDFLDIPPDIYFFTGFIMLFSNPELKNAAGSTLVFESRTIQPVIPLGVGIHYTLRQNIRLGFRLGSRKTFFDKLDGHSPAQGSRNDAYFFNSFSVSYFFEPRQTR